MRCHCLKICGKFRKKHAKSQTARVTLEIGKLLPRRAGRLAVWLRYGHEGFVRYAGQFNPPIQIIKSSATKGDNFSDWIERLARNIKPASI